MKTCEFCDGIGEASRGGYTTDCYECGSTGMVKDSLLTPYQRDEFKKLFKKVGEEYGDIVIDTGGNIHTIKMGKIIPIGENIFNES